MPARAKGIRLWLQPERRDKNGKLADRPVWVIRDGTRKRSTGCGPTEIEEAERKLKDYIAERHQPGSTGKGDPHKTLIADVIALYSEDIAPSHARPGETTDRLDRILSWWGSPETAQETLEAMNLPTAFSGVAADVRGQTCRAYVEFVGKPSAARRDLEDFRAALNHAFREGLLDRTVAVTLPEKPQQRERWLTRSEVARLVWAAWRHREAEKGDICDQFPRRHVARFILAALKTGSRSGPILGAAFERTPANPYADLERGVFYRQAPGRRQTKKRAPAIRLDSGLLAHMRRWQRNGQRFVVEFKGAPVGKLRRSFAAAVKDAGLGPDVTPHTLRHTAATWMMQNGADLWDAAGYLGMTVETLEQVYGHHHPGHMGTAIEALNAHRRRA